jgi:hypothetical protein
MVKIVGLRGQWAAAIGKAFVAFGSIEHITIVCLREIPKDRIQKSTSGFMLTPRIDLLLELLEAHQGDAFDQLAGHLKQAKSMVQTRNLIAHNPLVLSFYQDAEGEFTYEESIISLKKEGHKISLPELEAFAQRSEELASDLLASSQSAIHQLRGGT